MQDHEPSGAVMTPINLDALPEPVRRFSRGAVAVPAGAVIEQNGEPAAHVLRVPRPGSGSSAAGE